MNRQIWKFELQIRDKQTIAMPEDANILSIQEQGDGLFIWAAVDPTSELEDRDIEIFGTGHNILEGEGISRYHIATVVQKDKPFVWHVFEREY